MANKIKTTPTKQDRRDAKGKSAADIARDALSQLERSAPYSCTFLHLDVPGTSDKMRSEIEAVMKKSFENWAQSLAWKLRQIVAKQTLEIHLPDANAIDERASITAGGKINFKGGPSFGGYTLHAGNNIIATAPKFDTEKAGWDWLMETHGIKKP